MENNLFLDIRVEDSRGQSINLALSIRGREALRAIELEEAVVDRHSIPMHGRMVHNKDSTLREIIYDSVQGNVSNDNLELQGNSENF